MTRDQMLTELCRERGCWGDGSEATPQSVSEAARDPVGYDLDPDDLDEACGGDVAAIARLRSAFGLPILI